MSRCPVILYRRTQLPDEDEVELQAIRAASLEVYERRSHVPAGRLVVGRYSVLPFYAELDDDLLAQDSCLVNSVQGHRYVADLQNYYQDLIDLTPQTWFRMEDVPADVGPVVLKGETNSRKDRWDEMMYAWDKRSAVQVMLRLQADGLVGTQRIYVREFEQFESFGRMVSGALITTEFRFFCLGGQVIADGWYWSGHTEVMTAPEFTRGGGTIRDVQAQAREFVQSVVLPRIAGRVDFVVVDVARHVDGRWRVVELNDGQMSGLSCVDPGELYRGISLHHG